MTAFAENTWFEVEYCCRCHIAFAVPAEFRKKRLDDRGAFYCPAGHGQHFTGPTEAQKLKTELERKASMLQAAELRAETAEKDRLQVAKAHRKMRERVMNGVCPCCNRTFQNLMSHMRSEHPDFATVQTMLALRTAFAMTQAAVAREAGVDATHVSLYERGLHVAPHVKDRLDDWLDLHKARDESAAAAQEAALKEGGS